MVLMYLRVSAYSQLMGKIGRDKKKYFVWKRKSVLLVRLETSDLFSYLFKCSCSFLCYGFQGFILLIMGKTVEASTSWKFGELKKKNKSETLLFG